MRKNNSYDIRIQMSIIDAIVKDSNNLQEDLKDLEKYSRCCHGKLIHRGLTKQTSIALARAFTPQVTITAAKTLQTLAKLSKLYLLPLVIKQLKIVTGNVNTLYCSATQDQALAIEAVQRLAKNSTISIEIDPSMIKGFRLTSKAKTYDFSLAARLRKLRSTLPLPSLK